jgi:8-oxo-dGTP pyrophosphatase MutT (NUDIX family)
VIARDAAGRVLLVRHSYGSRAWSLPTGGVGRGEDPAGTALREFEEETGCILRGPRLLAVLEGDYYGARHTEHVFVGEVSGTPCADGREVVAVQFFALDALPAGIGSNTRERLALLSEQ